MYKKRKVNISAPRSAREGCIPFSLTPVNPRLANGKNVFRARMRMRETLSMAEDVAVNMSLR